MNKFLTLTCVIGTLLASESTAQGSFSDPLFVEDYLGDVPGDREYVISKILHDIEYFGITADELYDLPEEINGVGEYEVISSGGEFNGMYLHVLKVVPFDTLNHKREGDYVFYQCGGREWKAPIQIYDYFPVKLKRGDRVRF